MWEGRRVVLGVTGSIAAYKAAELARRLVQKQAAVTVLMTRNACRFVTPLTFQTVTGRPVATELFSDPSTPVAHVSLAAWAECVLVAPATADSLARAAQGRADDLLAAVILDTAAPVVWAPAMNTRMWENPATRENVGRLAARGHHIIMPAEGELACGESGAGRLPETEEIISAVEKILAPAGPLAGKKVLVTAGPTREPWDAVRFLSNRSTGKMGYQVAAAARKRGARVVLVSGPTPLPSPPGVRMVPVVTAQEMHDAAMVEYADADVVVAAAAVADFKPVQPLPGKIKKGQAPAAITLAPNPDILLEMGKQKGPRVLVGFAAESGDPVEPAKEKRVRKHCDLMVANQAEGPEDAFAKDEAAVIFVDAQGQVENHPRQAKEKIAALLCARVEKILADKSR
ncbi:bifunctional phosphopantothenoylcysteine decarboxylase/phosphopantothenate--cysteine ligase CoaBC [candidate division FCPU426 bacterium]|nr:bifunctional phosphopantothenoylcysteine decarboxylase/phosphopantothenate--cysteine ligase CoaBC [candidate division FCPU426 bacterium]